MMDGQFEKKPAGGKQQFDPDALAPDAEEIDELALDIIKEAWRLAKRGQKRLIHPEDIILIELDNKNAVSLIIAIKRKVLELNRTSRKVEITVRDPQREKLTFVFRLKPQYE